MLWQRTFRQIVEIHQSRKPRRSAHGTSMTYVATRVQTYHRTRKVAVPSFHLQLGTDRERLVSLIEKGDDTHRGTCMVGEEGVGGGGECPQEGRSVKRDHRDEHLEFRASIGVPVARG